jgi:hypothetical protein
MSTPGTEIEKDQGMPKHPPGSFHTQETVQQEKVFPQLPPQPPRPTRNRWFVVAAIGVVLVLILSIGAVVVAQWGQQPGGQAKPTPTVPGTTATVTPGGTDTTPTPPSGVTPGPQPGPTGVKDPAYWDPIIGTQSGVNQVESVSFANLMDTPALQALVSVRYTGADARLDVYVFDNIKNAKPTQIFKLTGLVKGDARISGYNTVMTAEVDKNSTLNAGKSVANMKPDLFREFDWQSSAGTLVQTAFPGIYPDLTRYQAEADQARVNKGQDPWKNDPVQVAKAFEAKFIDWKRTVTAKLLSGGGPKDVSATVYVQEASVQGAQGQGPFIKVTLSRLEGNTHNMWVVIGAEDGTMLTLKNIEPRQLVASPVTLEGTGAAFEAVIGRAVVFDHLYTDIGHAQVTALNAGAGKADYSTKVVYNTSFPQGVQEGLVAVYEDNGGISAEMYSVVMVKVLLDPEPGVALGPLPCPDKVKDPSYWNPFVSAPPDIQVADSVSCGNLLGKPSLQAMVVTREIVGGGPVFRSVYVFDKITDPKPQLLFKVGHLRHGEAAISGYSTVMTGEVDLNSPINKGRADTAVTVDLFREFQWSEGAGKFVQVAFPGIYPDLTRWQAEFDQRNVNAGQDNWKNDAAKVAQSMAVKLLKWSSSSQATIVSGGGSQDVDAVVQVKSTSPDHPVINVTLSRLEGDSHNMWVVIAVADGSVMSITSPAKWDVLTSPVTVKGTGSAFEGDVGTLFVLDHLYTDIGHAKGIPENLGKTTFTASVPYTASFHGGAQEGVLAFYRYSQADGAIAGVVMVKVLIKA